jgi:hypothetical protein
VPFFCSFLHTFLFSFSAVLSLLTLYISPVQHLDGKVATTNSREGGARYGVETFTRTKYKNIKLKKTKKNIVHLMPVVHLAELHVTKRGVGRRGRETVKRFVENNGETHS